MRANLDFVGMASVLRDFALRRATGKNHRKASQNEVQMNLKINKMRSKTNWKTRCLANRLFIDFYGFLVPEGLPLGASKIQKIMFFLKKCIFFIHVKFQWIFEPQKPRKTSKNCYFWMKSFDFLQQIWNENKATATNCGERSCTRMQPTRVRIQCKIIRATGKNQ